MTATSFQKILIANRGEIAMRIIQAVHALDKRAVVVHSEYDKTLPFVTAADEAYSLGYGDLSETYLNGEKIIAIAREAQVDAIHPGYGFLAENASFADSCLKNGLVFIGPSAQAIHLMGDKSSARKTASAIGIPVVDGFDGTIGELTEAKERLPYPVLIKPSAGGGGKGMRIVHSQDGFEESAKEASREAENYFGSGALYVERYLKDPRHIEVQVIADHFGNAVHLYERECSLQRRHQKIIEEAPAVSLTGALRERMTACALQLVREIGYTNAGTVEFLMENGEAFYFLEMNTRIQVEHPVTEMVTGIDLVKEQITISEGNPLSFSQEEVGISGHAIEARIYAEDPLKEFIPSAGRIECFQHDKETRLDTGYTAGQLVEPHYDPLIAKVIVPGSNREEARIGLVNSLKELHLTGLKTNRDFLIALARSEAFVENELHTRYIDQELEGIIRFLSDGRREQPEDMLYCAATLIALQSGSREGGQPSPWLAIGHWRIVPVIVLESEIHTLQVRYELLKGRRSMMFNIEGREHEVYLEHRSGDRYRIRVDHHVLHIWGFTDRSEIILDVDGHMFHFRRPDILDERYIGTGRRGNGKTSGVLLAPLNGRIVQTCAFENDQVKAGEPLVIIESMKTENKILAPFPAAIRKIHVSPGEQVRINQLIITLDPNE